MSLLKTLSMVRLSDEEIRLGLEARIKALKAYRKKDVQNKNYGRAGVFTKEINELKHYIDTRYKGVSE